MNTKDILQGIKNWAAPKVIFDISAAHDNTKYTDLSDALGTNGGNIPQEYRKGGITVRYVQSSDNKYVQFRYMISSTSVADFTNVANWQGVDAIPMPGSSSLVESGGVAAEDLKFKKSLASNIIKKYPIVTDNKYINSDGEEVVSTTGNYQINKYTNIYENFSYIFSGKLDAEVTIYMVFFYNQSNECIGKLYKGSLTEETVITNKQLPVPHGTSYICVNVIKANISFYDLVEVSEPIIVQNALFDLSKVVNILNEEIPSEITSGKRVDNSGVIQNSTLFSLRKYNIVSDKVYTFSGKLPYGVNNFLINYFDANGVFIDHHYQGKVDSAVEFNYVPLDIPEGTAYIYMNSFNTYASDFTLESIEQNPNNIPKELDKKIADLSNDLSNQSRGDIMLINKGLYIDKNHIQNINGQDIRYKTSTNYDSAIIFTENVRKITLVGLVSGANYRFYNSADIFTGDNIYSSLVGTNQTGEVPDGAIVCLISLKHTDYPNGYDNFYLEKIYGANRKKIRLLFVGNSASNDAIAYVPFILQNMGVDVDCQIATLMRSSATLQTHVNNFTNEESVYGFNLYNGSSSWSTGSEGENGVSIQWALDNYEWDIICLQQAQPQNINTYQPYCNQLINLISNYIGYPVKFIWYQTHIYAASVNGGAPRSEETINQYYESEVTACKDVIGETACEYVVPVSTAIQNARSIPSIKAIGDYSTNPNNETGFGYLNYYDGVHLQEGLPSQIAAYTFVLSLLDLYGFKECSINGETTRVTSEWQQGKNIPGPHGSPVGSTDANCLIAQKCAIMAIKHPYEVTDMSYIVNPT